MWDWPGDKLHLFPDWLETNAGFGNEGFTIKGAMTEEFASYVVPIFRRSGVRAIRSGNLVLTRPLDQWGFGGRYEEANWDSIDVFARDAAPDYANFTTMSPEMRERVRCLLQRGLGDGAYFEGVFSDCEAARALIMENGGR